MTSVQRRKEDVRTTGEWVPIAPGLIDADQGEPCLLGGRCTICGALSFPVQPGCGRCSSDAVVAERLPRRGSVWTWTSQEFLPKSPPYAGPEDLECFQPWYVGFVELENGLRVEGRLVGYADRQPAIGDAVELVLVPFRTKADGPTVMLYAFAADLEGVAGA